MLVIMGDELIVIFFWNYRVTILASSNSAQKTSIKKHVFIQVVLDWTFSYWI